MELHNAITDVPGIRVGHAQNLDALTGCTVVLCNRGSWWVISGAPELRDRCAPPDAPGRSGSWGVADWRVAFGLMLPAALCVIWKSAVGFNTGVQGADCAGGGLVDSAIGRADIRPDAAMDMKPARTRRMRCQRREMLAPELAQPLAKSWGPNKR